MGEEERGGAAQFVAAFVGSYCSRNSYVSHATDCCHETQR
jgi:hypothetical protein